MRHAAVPLALAALVAFVQATLTPAVQANPQRTAAQPPPRLTAQGWGPLRMDMTRAQVEQALGRDSQPLQDGGPDPARCDEFHPRRASLGLIVMVEEGRLTRVTATRRGLATVRGIRVGDPVAKVRAAYGRALEDTPHTYADPPARYLTAWTGKGATRRGIRYDIDERGRVGMIHAGTASIEYVEECL